VPLIDGLSPVTREGLAISNFFWLVMALSVLVLLVVVVPLAYTIVRYRDRPGAEGEPPQIHGNRRLEVTWTAAAALLIGVLFVIAVFTMGSVDAAAADAPRIDVIGHQWWWELRYRNQRVVTANELHVPVGEQVVLALASADVVHSFWVPRFGWKRDAVPGKVNELPVRVDQAGTFRGVCTEYCGTQHAWMRLTVIAEPRGEFDAWVRGQQAASSAEGRGLELFLSNTCASCHNIGGTAAGARVGPDLTHLASRSTLGAGVIENNPENLRRWIQRPQDVKPGVRMPNFTQLSDADLDALTQYLASLK
jgi:cytochrome c oxidase subunit 2